MDYHSSYNFDSYEYFLTINKKKFQIINYKDKTVAQLIHKLATNNSFIGFDGNIETFQKIEFYRKLVSKKIKFISVKNVIFIF